jgi:hypothetical protein
MRSFFANLATVLVRPRATMRRILDAPRDRAVIPLFVLAVLSGIFGDFDAPTMRQVLARSEGMKVALLAACVLLALIVVMVALAWFYSWVPYFIGRFLGGTGDFRRMRSAVAWGFAPAIWALLYRVPAAIWLSPSSATSVRIGNNTNVSFDPGRLADGCGVALFFALLEFGVFVWCVVVLSNTVAEAHELTAWQGLGTLVLSALVPVVVAIAAFLAAT